MRGLTFGQRLRRLREATVVTVARQSTRSRRWLTTCTMSQNELALRAGLDPALVCRLEAGTQPWHPRRQTVERLCDALELSPSSRADLLVSAGYWPWTDADDDVTELLVALAIAVLDGDYRPLAQSVRQATP